MLRWRTRVAIVWPGHNIHRIFCFILDVEMILGITFACLVVVVVVAFVAVRFFIWKKSPKVTICEQISDSF